MALKEITRSLDGYLAEWSEAPAALERLCRFARGEGASAFADAGRILDECDELLVYGMASSLWAAWPMVAALGRGGRRARSASAYEGIARPRASGDGTAVCVLVSQSGETAEIRALIESLDESGRDNYVVGVTNSPSSALGARADLLIDVRAGAEHHAPTKSYVNTIAALLLLCDPARAGETADALLELAASMEAARGAWASWGAEAAAEFPMDCCGVQFLAAGPQMASAWQSAMLCSETVRLFSAACDWATFRHGFEPAVGPRGVVVGFRPPEGAADVWQTTARSVRERGAPMLLVPGLNAVEPRGGGPLDPDILCALWETLPVHMLCIESARRSGLDASRIERKVTLDL